MTMRMALIGALAALLAGAGASLAAPATPRVAPSEMARAFAEQAAMCGRRQDTDHPAFHGCVDWHSAAHSAWALSAYARATGDAAYEPELAQRLDPTLIDREAADLRADPTFEMPYGRAWFMRLAVARPENAALQAMARDVALSLRRYYEQTPPIPTAAKYSSASWALINLLQYARANADRSLEAFVVGVVRERFLADPCPIAAERRGFIAVCVTWAWLVSEALPERQFRAWYARWNPGLETLEPLTTYASAHDYGLNFSRAWGLGRLARRLHDPALERAYIRHLDAGFDPPERWRGDYLETGHWVAQFGMLAIEPLLQDATPAKGPPARKGARRD